MSLMPSVPRSLRISYIASDLLLEVFLRGILSRTVVVVIEEVIELLIIVSFCMSFIMSVIGSVLRDCVWDVFRTSDNSSLDK